MKSRNEYQYVSLVYHDHWSRSTCISQQSTPALPHFPSPFPLLTNATCQATLTYLAPTPLITLIKWSFLYVTTDMPHTPLIMVNISHILLVYVLDHDDAHIETLLQMLFYESTYSPTPAESTTPRILPYFDSTSPTANLTTQLGGAVIFHCKVNDIVDEASVSMSRHANHIFHGLDKYLWYMVGLPSTLA